MESSFHLTSDPAFAIFSNDAQFVHVKTRIGQVDRYVRNAVVEHLEHLATFKAESGLNIILQLRQVFYDAKHAEFHCLLDYLVDPTNEDEHDFAFVFEHGITVVRGTHSYFKLAIREVSIISDHFDKNDRSFYENLA